MDIKPEVTVTVNNDRSKTGRIIKASYSRQCEICSIRMNVGDPLVIAPHPLGNFVVLFYCPTCAIIDKPCDRLTYSDNFRDATIQEIKDKLEVVKLPAG